MEQLLNNIWSNPIYIVISIVILILLIVFAIKKTIKLVIYILILCAGFLLYVHFTGGDVKDVIDRTKTEAKKHIDS